MESHGIYSDLVREVAAKEHVLLIDLDKESMLLYQQFGKENSKWLFMQLKPGDHPNYPNGRDDNTHFNELGARLIAQIILADIRTLIPDLSTRIVVSNIK
jgi:lysophospholipase L1-like esterase